MEYKIIDHRCELSGLEVANPEMLVILGRLEGCTTAEQGWVLIIADEPKAYLEM